MSESSPRTTRDVALFSLALLGVIALSVWMSGLFRLEPLYQGKPARWWVDQACDLRMSDAMNAVGAIGPRAVPYLIAKLEPETRLHLKLVHLHDLLPSRIREEWTMTRRGVSQQEMSAQCLCSLGRAGRPAVPILCRELADPHAPVWSLAQALGAIGEDAASAVPALHHILTNEPVTRVEVASALWRIARETNTVLEVCQKVISRRDPGAMNAANLLGDLGPAAAPLVSLLVQTMQDSTIDSAVRGNAAGAIGRTGVKSSEVIGALLVGLQDGDLYVRAQSATSLWRLDSHKADLALSTVVDWLLGWNRKSPVWRRSLVQFAQGSHLSLAAARGKLVELSQTGSPDVSAPATEALKVIDTRSATNSIQK